MYLLAEGEDLLNKVADVTLAYSDDSDEVEVEKGVYKIIMTESGTDTILASTDSITISTGDATIFALTGYLVAGSDELVNAIVQWRSITYQWNTVCQCTFYSRHIQR